ncbi:stage V sporulation protein K [Cladorrhinum sp. PSN259]|nr:stage V sporulation protein K [Cladorrhinum sp. PSN259]
MAPSSSDTTPDPLDSAPELDLVDRAGSDTESPISTPVEGEVTDRVTLIVDGKTDIIPPLLGNKKSCDTKVSIAEVLPSPTDATEPSVAAVEKNKAESTPTLTLEKPAHVEENVTAVEETPANVEEKPENVEEAPEAVNGEPATIKKIPAPTTETPATMEGTALDPVSCTASEPCTASAQPAEPTTTITDPEKIDDAKDSDTKEPSEPATETEVSETSSNEPPEGQAEPAQEADLSHLYELGRNWDFGDEEVADTEEKVEVSQKTDEETKEETQKTDEETKEETQKTDEETKEETTEDQIGESKQEVKVETQETHTEDVPEPVPEPKPAHKHTPKPEYDPFIDCKRIRCESDDKVTEDNDSPLPNRPGMPLLPALGRQLLQKADQGVELLPPEKEWERQKKELGQKSRAIDKVMAMVGIEDVKKAFLTVRSTITAAKTRKGKLRRQDFNLALIGNPGTGKKTLAGLYKDLLAECGIWKGIPHVENKAGYDFQNDKDIEALHVLLAGFARGSDVYVFVDSIEGIYPSLRDDLLFTLDRHCERIRLVVSVAGTEEAVSKFLAAKMSGRWQFPRRMIIKNYEEEELRLILLQMIKHNGFKVEGGLDGPFPRIAARRISRNRESTGFANVYDLILSFEQMLGRQAVRLEKEKASILEAKQKVVAVSDGEKKDETKETAVEEKATHTSAGEEPVEASARSNCDDPTKNIETKQVDILKEESTKSGKTDDTATPTNNGRHVANEESVIQESENNDAIAKSEERPDGNLQPETENSEIQFKVQSGEVALETVLEFKDKQQEEIAGKTEASTEGKAEAKSGDKPQDKIEVESEDNPEQKTQAKTEEGLEEKPEIKSEEKPEDISKEVEVTPNIKGGVKSEAEPNIKSENKPEEKTEREAEEQLEANSKGAEVTPEMKQEVKAPAESEVKSEETAEEKPGVKIEEKSEKISDEKTEDKTEEEKSPEPDHRFLTKEDIIGPEPEDTRSKSKSWQELSKMAGLEHVKKAIGELLNREKANYRRELLGKEPLQASLNRVFLGPPGTGKTTVAKLYGQILAEIGLLTTKEVVTKTPGDFIGQYIGESEEKTSQILDSTLGKVLIIDDAHMFYHGSRAGAGHEADEFRLACIDIIVSKIHNRPGENRCVILLGYPDMMEDMFQKSNPGLRRRFPLEDAFRFENYDDKTLNQILRLKMEKEEITAEEGAMGVAAEVLRRARDRPNFGNGGDVDNLLGMAKTRFRERLDAQRKLEAETAKPKDGETLVNDLVNDAGNQEVKIVLKPEDFDPDWDRGQHASKKCQALFEGLIGFSSIIGKFEGYQRIAANMRRRGRDPRDIIPFTFIFKGPPGTGKTHTARIVGQIFYDMGFLSTNDVIECSASHLIGQYLGHTAPKVVNLFEKALGKVLFIDEAYRLNSGAGGTGRHSFEEEAVGEIVDCMTKERYHKKMIIVLAGYDKDMDNLMAVNAGLRGRFATEIVFPPMSASRSREHLINLLKKEDIEIHDRIDPGDDEKEKVLRFLHKLGQTPGWSNGRDIKTLAANITGSVYRNAILEEIDEVDAEADGKQQTFKISTIELNGHLKDMLRQRNR